MSGRTQAAHIYTPCCVRDIIAFSPSCNIHQQIPPPPMSMTSNSQSASQKSRQQRTKMRSLSTVGKQLSGNTVHTRLEGGISSSADVAKVFHTCNFCMLIPAIISPKYLQNDRVLAQISTPRASHYPYLDRPHPLHPASSILSPHSQRSIIPYQPRTIQVPPPPIANEIRMGEERQNELQW